ncbi:alpha/beta hydrolase [Pandoraea thiooxydans]|uniref:Alpha/beta hydrolase n=1 Tax=Pandoraea thiooxydans TaxID=445709 RepID=A0A0G3ENS1_9BURK|nr:alpha/beta hydrolase [Pandoraea thiooxydans]AKJ67654.1 alpha/beta hydrolase [Pandoraea thiooxydans]APR94770.1 alpha/beta hydrolase [Pandoraea thiooxydans]
MPSSRTTITYRTVPIDGLDIFYREAGHPDAPTVVLLHGFPSSSRMYETLIPLLAARFHVLAPDYPGFGHSSAPSPQDFDYTFDNLAHFVGRWLDTLEVRRYALFVQDYGGPIGLRLAEARSASVTALIVQNAVAHEAGLGPLWDTRKAFWHDRARHESALRKNLISFEATRLRHVGHSPNPQRYDPDAWCDEFAFLSRPGQVDIQTELFYDYRNNVAAYPRWQAWLREHRPPLLVVWGRHDPSFAVQGALAYQQDVPEAEVHLLEAGHFALDEAVDEVAHLTREFLGRLPTTRAG